MPRPVLARLGVHYRRIPILAVGRDIYCDSRAIISALEAHYTATAPLGAQDPHGRGLERVLETWAFDGGLFAWTAQLIPADALLMLSQSWRNDRAELMGRPFEVENLKKGLPDALAQARGHLETVEAELLGDGRNWLGGGEEPGLADVHVLWIFDWMFRPKERMGMRDAYPEMLNRERYPRTMAWAARMEEVVAKAREEVGSQREIGEEEVVKAIEGAEFWRDGDLVVDGNDPSGLKRGDEVDLIALDSAPKTGSSRRDVGTLEGLTVRSATIGTSTEHGVDVRIHYQRQNVRVAKASGAPRLAATEIPKL